MHLPHVPRVLTFATFAALATLASTASAQSSDSAPIPPEWVAPDTQAPSRAPQPPTPAAAPPQAAAPQVAPPGAAAPPPGWGPQPTASPAPMAPVTAPATTRPPPLRTEPYSKPMMIGGGVAAGLGAFLLLFGGIGGFDDEGDAHDGGNDTRTTASVVLGSVFVLGGTPLLIIGAQSVPVDEGQARRSPAPTAPFATPRVRISATSADATWRF